MARRLFHKAATILAGLRATAPALLLLAGLISGAPARAGDKPPEAFGEVSFETPEGGAYAQEMVTMVVRFYFKVRATTEELEQPKLDELGWTQLGRDSWAPTKIGSANWFGFERRIAVFAPEAKTYTIPPFIHHVTLIDAQGVRWKVDARSKPVQLSIRKWTGKADGPEDENTWWLPARSIEIKDSWSIDPSTIAAGETTRRRLDVTAVGTLAEQLPPMIETQAPGLVVFPGPVERRTEVANGIPIAHAVYSYDVRPHTGDPVILQEVLVPWFDTAAREMRQAIVPGVSVGRGMVVAGAPLADAPEAGPAWPRQLLAGLAALLVGLGVLLFPGRRDREPVLARLPALLTRLRRTYAVRQAAWRGRPEELRAGLYALAREDGAAGAAWLAASDVRERLARLDAALFGRGVSGGEAAPATRGPLSAAALRQLARAALSARAAALAARRDKTPNLSTASPFGN